jgi:hypothetical protein
MKHKVVYNNCFGGFSLSKKAGEWLLEHNIEEPYKSAIEDDIQKINDPESIITSVYSEIPRHHPLLVQCVEELGKAANGECAKLVIEEIYSNIYKIVEYDGNETIITRDTIDWVVIK